MGYSRTAVRQGFDARAGAPPLVALRHPPVGAPGQAAGCHSSSLFGRAPRGTPRMVHLHGRPRDASDADMLRSANGFPDRTRVAENRAPA